MSNHKTINERSEKLFTRGTTSIALVYKNCGWTHPLKMNFDVPKLSLTKELIQRSTDLFLREISASAYVACSNCMTWVIQKNIV